MDLRSIINNNEAGEGSTKKQAVPVPPIHPHPQGVEDYGHPPQASPGARPAQDRGPDALQSAGRYVSPTSYKDQGPFSNRPHLPSQIPTPSRTASDLGSLATSYTTQSPFTQIPSLEIKTTPYSKLQSSQSPGQYPQYPPNFQARDSLPQSNLPPPPPHMQPGNPQAHSSTVPQTPPTGMPGAAHPYLHHQRSQSSASTPTSAQSQSTYFGQYHQNSPVLTSQLPPSQIPAHQRQQSQQSQPDTPPLETMSRRLSPSAFAQPASPYHQRGLSTGPFSQFQTSPAPTSSSASKLPSTPGGYDSQRTSTSEPHKRSQSERQRSISVSPKTRLPSQPGDSACHQQPMGSYTPSAKRKMDDREAAIEQPRSVEQSEVKSNLNGNQRTPSVSGPSPKQQPKKRTRYLEPPIWARSVIGRTKSSLGPIKVNHKANGAPPAATLPRQAAPPPVKPETNGHDQIPRPVAQGGDPSRLLGPWEKSITGQKPFEQMTKVVADWLYLNVVSRDDVGELASRGVEVEIEAKLGQLIDKDGGQRFHLPVISECILAESGRVGFRSSMTEVQHRSLNDFLNHRVTDTHPHNPGAQSRVPIDYLHRRETDKFYELPPSHLASLPPAVREQLNPRHPVKVRVTYAQEPKDQKTILAKIIKARIADINIYNPHFPLDCRISINFELRYEGDVQELKAISLDNRIPDRNKDRLSYKQSHYQIDLTQVTQLASVNGANQINKEHELEIEISTAAVREQGRRAATGEPNEYVSLVEGFLDNMRVLARAVPPP